MVLSVRFFLFSLFLLPFFLSFSQSDLHFFPYDKYLFFPYDKKYLEELKERNFTLYNFEKRLKDIQKEIQRLIRDYRERKISKGELKDKLKPLIKEEIGIVNNPEYITEKRLERILHMLPPQKTKSIPPVKIKIYPEK